MDGYVDLLENDMQFPTENVAELTGKQLLDRIVPDNISVLDYGCGKRGTITKKQRVIESFDDDCRNAFAGIHDRGDISGWYDAIVCHHVVEHMVRDKTFFEMMDFYDWSVEHCKYLYVGQPNPANFWVFVWLDLTHTRPYHAETTARHLESIGYDVEKIIYCNIEPGIRRRIFDWCFSVNPYQEWIIVARRR